MTLSTSPSGMGPHQTAPWHWWHALTERPHQFSGLARAVGQHVPHMSFVSTAAVQQKPGPPPVATLVSVETLVEVEAVVEVVDGLPEGAAAVALSARNTTVVLRNDMLGMSKITSTPVRSTLPTPSEVLLQI